MPIVEAMKTVMVELPLEICTQTLYLFTAQRESGWWYYQDSIGYGQKLGCVPRFWWPVMRHLGYRQVG